LKYINLTEYAKLRRSDPEIKEVRLPVLVFMSCLVVGPKSAAALNLEVGIGHKTAYSHAVRHSLIEKGITESFLKNTGIQNGDITNYQLTTKWKGLAARLFTNTRPAGSKLLSIDKYRKQCGDFPDFARLSMITILLFDRIKNESLRIPDLIRESERLYMPALGGCRETNVEKGLITVEKKKGLSTYTGLNMPAQYISLTPISKEFMKGIITSVRKGSVAA
jgi:hypothetical protein